jgi:hypothetical protein
MDEYLDVIARNYGAGLRLPISPAYEPAARSTPVGDRQNSASKARPWKEPSINRLGWCS